MNRLLERPFTGERYEKESAPDTEDSIERRTSPLLRRPEHMRKTGSVALNTMLERHGWLTSRDFQDEIFAPTENSLHDSN